MFKTAVLSVLALVVLALLVVLAIASTRPNDFSLQRSTRIQAAPEKIFPLIADFRQWPLWSPWEKLDPDVKRTFAGATSGPGAVYEWQGSSKVGAGRMEIKEASAASKVVIQLDFLKPFESHNITDFSLVPGSGGTEAIWRMRGPNLFVSKMMSVFVDMDAMIGKDFEKGLAQLKAAAEK